MSLRKNITSIILISIGIFIPVISKYDNYKNNYQEQININNYLNNRKSPYLMILDIPKIKLNKGIYDLNSRENNISKNIELLNYSNLDTNTIVLASHSGTASNAYFNNVPNLSINDKIYIYYNHKKYTYIINDIYYIDKTGFLEIDNNIDNTLILITCSLLYNNKQIIVSSTLNNIEII